MLTGCYKVMVFLVASLLLLGGCSFGLQNNVTPPNKEQLPSSNQVQLSFVYAGGDPTIKAAIANAVEGFMLENPGITILQDSSGSGSYTDYLQMKDVVGEFPDMMEMRDTQWYVDAGRLAELPEELTALIDTPAEVGGKHYTLPMTGPAPSGFLYNKDIFEQANITSPPRTWEEFLKACEKIKQLGFTPLVIGGKDLGHFNQLLNKLLMDNVYADDQNWNSKRTAGTASFTDAGVMQAMHDFAELFKKGYVNTDWAATSENQTITVLLSRKAAILYGGSHMINPIIAADTYFKIGYFVPRDRKGRLVLNTLPGQAGLALSAEAAKDPNKLEAFSHFIKYFYKMENYAEFLGGSALPATKYQMEQQYTKPMELVLETAAEKHIPSRQLNDFWGMNTMPPTFGDWFYSLVKESLLTGKPTIYEVMQKADKEWDRLIAERNESGTLLEFP
ncbi:ABC transporter substrate-binding protein [Paenibacillus paridis]|uniref:ABC transporter substrate-binding protein n=1 Tax=Paenibacillus paridis TaxID=2583376 RepID=UPI00111EB6BB|nr:extracellular solute-binding protein [Paenibacillus paridis]